MLAINDSPPDSDLQFCQPAILEFGLQARCLYRIGNARAWRKFDADKVREEVHRAISVLGGKSSMYAKPWEEQKHWVDSDRWQQAVDASDEKELKPIRRKIKKVITDRYKEEDYRGVKISDDRLRDYISDEIEARKTE